MVDEFHNKLHFMRGDYRVTKRVDGDFDAVDFAVKIFAVFVDAAVGGEDLGFAKVYGVGVGEFEVFEDAVGSHRGGVDAVDGGEEVLFVVGGVGFVKFVHLHLYKP